MREQKIEGKRRENGGLQRGILVEESQNMLLMMSKLKGQNNADISKGNTESKKNFENMSKLSYLPPSSSSQQPQVKEKANKPKNIEGHHTRDEIAPFKKKRHTSTSQDRRSSAQMVKHSFILLIAELSFLKYRLVRLL